jgi:hypothetical protein
MLDNNSPSFWFCKRAHTGPNPKLWIRLVACSVLKSVSWFSISPWKLKCMKKCLKTAVQCLKLPVNSPSVLQHVHKETEMSESGRHNWGCKQLDQLLEDDQQYFLWIASRGPKLCSPPEFYTIMIIHFHIKKLNDNHTSATSEACASTICPPERTSLNKFRSWLTPREGLKSWLGGWILSKSLWTWDSKEVKNVWWHWSNMSFRVSINALFGTTW